VRWRGGIVRSVASASYALAGGIVRSVASASYALAGGIVRSVASASYALAGRHRSFRSQRVLCAGGAASFVP